MSHPPERADTQRDAQRTRLVIAHPHALLRRGLSSALVRDGGIDVVGEADQLSTLLDSVRELRTGVGVVDIDLPGMKIPESLELLQAAGPEVRILLLANETHEEALIHILRAGGGFLTHGYTAPALAQAVHALARGEAVFPRKMLSGLLDKLVKEHEDREIAIRKVSLLSEREKDVLRLLTEGANNEVIAEALVISPQTARTHIQNILVKMNLHSRLEAVAYVRKHHLGPELARQKRGR